MKLNNNDLRLLYISHLKEEIPHTRKKRKKCPSPKELLRLFRTKNSGKKKIRMIEHLTGCFYCAKEFEFILNALRYERQMSATAERLLSTKREYSSSKNSGHKQLAAYFSWKFSYLVGLISGICILITFHILFIKPKSPVYRSASQSQIRLIFPNKTKISKSSLFFRWERLMSSDYYIFEIFDEALYQIWKSPKLAKNSLRLPSDISNRIKENKHYFWMITAFFADGKVIESPLKEFYLVD